MAARFKGSIKGTRATVTRQSGAKTGMTVSVEGKYAAVKTDALTRDDPDTDVFHIYAADKNGTTKYVAEVRGWPGGVEVDYGAHGERYDAT